MSHEHEFLVEKIPASEADAVVYRLRGVMGESRQCYAFLEAFLADLEGAPTRLIFNLGGLENMYSSGIGIIANCFTKATEAGRMLVVTNVPEVIHRTLTIAGIQPMLQQYETEEEALAAPAE